VRWPENSGSTSKDALSEVGQDSYYDTESQQRSCFV
jgi:hypothetical protein